MKKPLLLVALLALTACDWGPSKSAIQDVLNDELQDTNKSIDKFGGLVGLNHLSKTVSGTDKITVEQMHCVHVQNMDGVYECDLYVAKNNSPSVTHLKDRFIYGNNQWKFLDD